MLPPYSIWVGPLKSVSSNSLQGLGMIMCIQAHFMSSLEGVLSLVCVLWGQPYGLTEYFWYYCYFCLNFCIRENPSCSVVFSILPNSRGESVTGVIYDMKFTKIMSIECTVWVLQYIV